MDFSESETVTTLRGVVRDFFKREVLPLEPSVRRDGFVASLPKLARARERARETGLFAAFMPKDVGGAGLTLLGARVIEGGAEPSLVFTYQGGPSLWTLQHLLVEPDLEGKPVATRVTPTGDLEAWRAPSAAGDIANDAVFVAWREGGTSWVLSADAPPDDVLYVAARIRQARAILRVPFLGDPASMSPAGATE